MFRYQDQMYNGLKTSFRPVDHFSLHGQDTTFRGHVSMTTKCQMNNIPAHHTFFQPTTFYEGMLNTNGAIHSLPQINMPGNLLHPNPVLERSCQPPVRNLSQLPENHAIQYNWQTHNYHHSAPTDRIYNKVSTGDRPFGMHSLPHVFGSFPTVSNQWPQPNTRCSKFVKPVARGKTHHKPRYTVDDIVITSTQSLASRKKPKDPKPIMKKRNANYRENYTVDDIVIVSCTSLAERAVKEINNNSALLKHIKSGSGEQNDVDKFQLKQTLIQVEPPLKPFVRLKENNDVVEKRRLDDDSDHACTKHINNSQKMCKSIDIFKPQSGAFTSNNLQSCVTSDDYDEDKPKNARIKMKSSNKCPRTDLIYALHLRKLRQARRRQNLLRYKLKPCKVVLRRCLKIYKPQECEVILVDVFSKDFMKKEKILQVDLRC